MKSYDSKQLIKYVGGGLIVIAAFGIMAPGLLSYLLGLGRLIGLIVTIISVAFLVAFIYNRLKPKRYEPPEPSFETTDDTD